jgi:hypothetical protein
LFIIMADNFSSKPSKKRDPLLGQDPKSPTIDYGSGVKGLPPQAIASYGIPPSLIHDNPISYDPTYHPQPRPLPQPQPTKPAWLYPFNPIDFFNPRPHPRPQPHPYPPISGNPRPGPIQGLYGAPVARGTFDAATADPLTSSSSPDVLGQGNGSAIQ